VRERRSGRQVADNRHIAAIAAALAALEAQSSETAAIGAGGGSSAARPGGGSAPSPWALYGRQRIMNMRALMQRRGSSRRV